MNNSIQVFHYEGLEVRTVELDGEIWFVGKDVALVLGYKDTRSAVIDHVEDEDKQTRRIATPSNGGYSDMVIINESGLYSLIFSSQLPTARQFKHWVTSEVLPAIRKTGSYSMRKELNINVMECASFILQTAGIKENQLTIALDNLFHSYTGHSALKEGRVELEAPSKHQILNPTEIGRQFNISAAVVNNILAGAGYQHKIGEKWEPLELGMPYAVMLDTGRRHGDGTPIRQLKWDSSILDVFGELVKEAS